MACDFGSQIRAAHPAFAAGEAPFTLHSSGIACEDTLYDARKYGYVLHRLCTFELHVIVMYVVRLLREAEGTVNTNP